MNLKDRGTYMLLFLALALIGSGLFQAAVFLMDWLSRGGN